MTRWHFRRLEGDQQSIDACNLRRTWLEGKSADEILTLQLVADGVSVSLADLFDLAVDDSLSDSDHLVVEGDLKNVHGLGAKHDRGDFQLIGTVGDSLACGMTGGTLLVDGDAGDFVAGPIGSHNTGMSGGVVKISGSVGSYAGHRMRRGTLLVQSNAGAMLAASMVAGTICVGGEVGDSIAVGMKRGSIILASGTALARQADAIGGSEITAGQFGRFSKPTRFDPMFFRLFSDPFFHDLTTTMQRLPVFRTRADRNVGGLGEIIFPASPELALASV